MQGKKSHLSSPSLDLMGPFWRYRGGSFRLHPPPPWNPCYAPGYTPGRRLFLLLTININIVDLRPYDQYQPYTGSWCYSSSWSSTEMSFLSGGNILSIFLFILLTIGSLYTYLMPYILYLFKSQCSAWVLFRFYFMYSNSSPNRLTAC